MVRARGHERRNHLRGHGIVAGQIVDTNAAYLGTELASLGVNHYYTTAVGDNLERATAAIRAALARAEVILITGGIGPTLDDVTREAMAAALDEESGFPRRLAQELREFFAARNRPWWTSTSARLTSRPRPRQFPNPVGTAPGVRGERRPSGHRPCRGCPMR